jgi:hypothetical protein
VQCYKHQLVQCTATVKRAGMYDARVCHSLQALSLLQQWQQQHLVCTPHESTCVRRAVPVSVILTAMELRCVALPFRTKLQLDKTCYIKQLARLLRLLSAESSVSSAARTNAFYGSARTS